MVLLSAVPELNICVILELFCGGCTWRDIYYIDASQLITAAKAGLANPIAGAPLSYQTRFLDNLLSFDGEIYSNQFILQEAAGGGSNYADAELIRDWLQRPDVMDRVNVIPTPSEYANAGARGDVGEKIYYQYDLPSLSQGGDNIVHFVTSDSSFVNESWFTAGGYEPGNITDQFELSYDRFASSGSLEDLRSLKDLVHSADTAERLRYSDFNLKIAEIEHTVAGVIEGGVDDLRIPSGVAWDALSDGVRAELLRGAGEVAGGFFIALDAYDTRAEALKALANGDLQHADELLGGLLGRTFGSAFAAALLGGEAASLPGAIVGAIIGGIVGAAGGTIIGEKIASILYQYGIDASDLLHVGDWISELFDPLFVRRDPLILDLNGDGIGLSDLAHSSTHFDLDGDGFAERVAWSASFDDAFLALDRNGDGKIDQIGDLFGSRYQDGFAMLAELDSNGDGVISSADSQWHNLRAWTDSNGNAQVDDGELHTMEEVHVASVSLSNAGSSATINGNAIVKLGSLELDSGVERTVAAVDLQSDRMHTDFVLPTGFAYDPEIFTLPNLKGYGHVPDLWVAMSLDPTLKQMVKDLVSQGADINKFGDVVGHAQAVYVVLPGQTVLIPNWDSNDFDEMLHRWAASAGPLPPGSLDPAQLDLPDGSPWWDAAAIPGVELATETMQAFLNRTFSDSIFKNFAFYRAFEQFTTSYAERFYSQIARLDQGSVLHAVIDALNADPTLINSSDGLASIAAIAASSPIEPHEMSDFVATLQGLNYSLEEDTLLSPATALVHYLSADLDIGVTGLDQGAQFGFWNDELIPWKSDNNIVLSVVDPSGQLMSDEIRARSGNTLFIPLAQAHDVLVGSSGDDQLNATANATTAFVGGGGDDTLNGSAGTDIFVFSGAFGRDVINGNGGVDEIAFQDAAHSLEKAHFAFGGSGKTDLLITFEGASDSLLVHGYFNVDLAAGISRISFSDGQIADQRLIRDQALSSLADHWSGYNYGWLGKLNSRWRSR